MKFYVTRTSNWGHTNSPCEGAIEEKHSFENRYGEKHEMIRFYINIESLEELMEFTNKQATEIVVSTNFEGNPAIEIYDDYRE